MKTPNSVAVMLCFSIARVMAMCSHGVEKSIFYKGEECGVETVYSDSLAALFLKAKRRGQFGDKTELSGPGGTPLTVNVRSFPLPDAPAGHALDAPLEAILLPAGVPTPAPDDFV